MIQYTWFWHILLMILFGWTLSQPGFSQNSNVPTDQIDSLKVYVSQLSENDPQYTSLTSLYAQMCFDSLRIIDGMEATKRLKEIAEVSGNNQNLGYFHEALGFLHSYSQLKEANQVKADWLLKQHHEFNRWGGIEGRKNIQSDTAGVAIDAYEQALKHYQVLKDTFSVRHLHAELAMMYRWWKLPSNTYKETEEIRKYQIHRDEVLNLYPDNYLDTPEGILLNLVMKIQQLEDLWFQQINQTSEIELSLANQVSTIKDPFNRAWGYQLLSHNYGGNNRYFLGLSYNANSLDLLQQLGETNLQSFCYYHAASIYQRASVRQPELRTKVIENCEKAIRFHQQMNYTKGIEKVYWLYVQTKRGLNEDAINQEPHETGRSEASSIPDSINRAMDHYFNYLGNNLNSTLNRQLFAFHQQEEAAKLYKTGNAEQALENNFRALNLLLSIADFRGASYSALVIANNFKEEKSYEKALQYAIQGYQYATETTWTITMISGSALVAELYEETGQLGRAIEYLKINQQLVTENERLNNQIQFTEMQVAGAIKESQHEIDRLDTQRKMVESENENQRIILVMAGILLVFLLVFSVVIYRNSVSRKKANQELSQQRDSLQKTLLQLQSTQSQLIQSEKMASLGELTAGIAHEIQNPLNFVNNFSEVNSELAAELESELEQKNYAEAKELAKDIRENETKINHHGKRADAIVKGMLQHSRSSTGTKEPTDINALVDEYLRLSYHGLRAKDKSFNASMETDYDKSIGNINIIPQDMGRVVLNLINNAFFAVHEQAKSGKEGYEPTVSVSTKQSGDLVTISVKDNGPGIPDSIKDKIFQPFFTTKDTGQGTGLGLSLAYDIVKAHGGELTVESHENEGTDFTIKLSLS
ncbi:ATP-binding protein [Algoriphagus persicinus]|uniref:ATP-binding protein n=1 Tax=Algoriphagus persicinus TaxID=3108754 RepID=UPI002B3C131F|nr:ATP-binding protein [Algoriphagus sp. E1-3-M2]MEB2784481.1 ATP-binding protein [Algoriphagus sp. E1-3-M2]